MRKGKHAQGTKTTFAKRGLAFFLSAVMTVSGAPVGNLAYAEELIVSEVTEQADVDADVYAEADVSDESAAQVAQKVSAEEPSVAAAPSEDMPAEDTSAESVSVDESYSDEASEDEQNVEDAISEELPELDEDTFIDEELF